LGSLRDAAPEQEVIERAGGDATTRQRECGWCSGGAIDGLHHLDAICGRLRPGTARIDDLQQSGTGGRGRAIDTDRSRAGRGRTAIDYKLVGRRAVGAKKRVETERAAVAHIGSEDGKLVADVGDVTAGEIDEAAIDDRACGHSRLYRATRRVESIAWSNDELGQSAGGGAKEVHDFVRPIVDVDDWSVVGHIEGALSREDALPGDVHSRRARADIHSVVWRLEYQRANCSTRRDVNCRTDTRWEDRSVGGWPPGAPGGGGVPLSWWRVPGRRSRELLRLRRLGEAERRTCKHCGRP